MRVAVALGDQVGDVVVVAGGGRVLGQLLAQYVDAVVGGRDAGAEFAVGTQRPGSARRRVRQDEGVEQAADVVSMVDLEGLDLDAYGDVGVEDAAGRAGAWITMLVIAWEPASPTRKYKVPQGVTVVPLLWNARRPTWARVVAIPDVLKTAVSRRTTMVSQSAPWTGSPWRAI